MGKSVAKGSFYDDSYPRKSLYEEEPGGRSLKAAKQNMRDLSRDGMTLRSHKGTTAVHGAVNGVLKSTPALGNKGITSLLPVFDGSSSRSFVLWLCEVKSCFMKQYLSDSEKCELVVSCLKGYALLWFKTLNVSRLTKGKSMIRSWHKLEPLMIKQYAPSCTLEKSKADLYALKQKLLSVNKDTKPCEMNQPLCEKSLEPKPEIVKQTKLEIACSPDEVNYVSDAFIVRCLNPMENESMNVDHEEDDEGLVLTPSKPLKLTKTDLALTHYENKNQIPNLSPNETISNHLFFVCQAQKNNQPTSHFTTEIHESLVKPHPTFETCVMRGKSPELSTPHFHFYMLVRLQDSLVQLSANPYIMGRKNGGMAQFESGCPILKLLSYGKFQGLEYHCCALIEMEKGLSTSEMFILRISKWKLNFDSEMNQFKPCCPVLKFLCFEVNLVQMHCEHLLEVFGISGASSLHEFGGVLTLLVVFVLKLVHKNSSSPLMALLCSNGGIDSYHGLSLGAYMLLVSQCGIIVVKLGVEPPWPFGEGYMESIERKTGMGTNRGHESAHASSLNVHFSILVAELLSASPMSPKQAIMVFDPGGNDVISVHEIITAL